MIITVIIIAACILDFLLGDPPNRFHPVAWTGRWINRLWSIRPSGTPGLFIWGILITLSGIILFALPLSLLEYLPEPVLILLSIPLLKLSFSLRNLFRAAADIKKLLASGDLEEARTQTSRHLVSRDTSELPETGIAAAVIESVAENITDSFTSPLFYFLLFGLPGAWAYRWVNTCDAMLGYRRDDYEWGGKFAARLDDIINFIPARITAFSIIIAGIGRRNLKTVCSGTVKNRQKTDSPNAGWTMAAIASLLDIRLEKKGYYIINEKGREPETGDIGACIKICKAASVILLLITALSGILAYGI